MDWFRWHHGTVNDPKLRVIANKARQPLPAVIAVWAAMLERASSADIRGTIDGWDPEAVAAGLDLDPDAVAAIYEAMQGRTLNGPFVVAWEKRQPLRERNDHSTERVRKHRANHETPRNAKERQETPRLDEIRVEEKEKKKPSVSKKAKGWKFCPEDFQPTEKHAALAKELGVDMLAQLAAFKDHEFREPKSDPDRAFNRWLRTAPTFERPPTPARPQFGNERDVDRAAEARRRHSNAEAARRDQEAEEAERDVQDAWDWLEMLDAATRADVEREVRERKREFGRLGDSMQRTLTLTVINERRQKGAA